MFSWRNRKDISIFQMKNMPNLLLCEKSNPICMDNKKQYCQLLCFAQRVLKVKTSNSVFRENGGLPTKNYQFSTALTEN